MADISSITLPGGGTYDLKDKNAVPKYGMGKNLIDNWYFIGGGTGRGVFPVNQRNASSAVSGYFIDRWRSGTVTGFSLSLSAAGLSLTNSGTQNVASPQDLTNARELLGKRVTYSILTTTGLYKNSGVLPSTFDNSGGQISISDGTNVIGQLYVTSSTVQARLRSPAGSGTITFVAVKLELGREQTLAHQENGVWVLNEIPDYEEELIKCQTSTADPSDTYANKTLATEQQLAYVETSTTASRAYAVGEFFCLNGLLYLVTVAISSGGTFTPGTNCEATDIGQRLTALDRFSIAVCPTGSSANPTTYTVAFENSHSYLVYIGRITNQFVGYFAIIQANGTVNLNTIASSGNGYFTVSTASKTLTITSRASGITVAWIDLGKP